MNEVETIMDINECKEDVNENDDEDNVDKDMAAEVLDSGEAYGEKILNKVDDELEYVGEDEEERQLNQNENEISDDDNEEIENENNEDENDVKPNLDDIQILKKKTKKIDASRIDRILNTSDMIQSYSYDGENMQWFEITFKVNKKYY